ncbi:MAG: tellurite resistance TerB family protein [Desulfobulbus sp.]|uniref:DUF533 domain-containing protein n=1 Tax=Desulfobulbus sp. TaxID=895 RepID=UPI00284A8F3C|nr:DUF533 domain-containing protein [Desulfobulbus sp.]MDR2549993.1 tellurite resistance TerB family protein [Desulfobulbus sp.]
MFNVEKLLGKMVGEVVGKSGSWGGGKASKLGGLGAGSGLMTLIGLGVGAYEILQQQKQQSSAGSPNQPPPPPGSGAGSSMPPPPPPQATPTRPPLPGGELPNVAALSAGGLEARELATRMIQVMVAATHADGGMDADEERAVLDRLRGAELNQEEKMFLLEELHRPQSIEALTAGIDDPAVAKTMYMLAVAAITIDTEAERTWLDQLGERLGISQGMRSFLEEQR